MGAALRSLARQRRRTWACLVLGGGLILALGFAYLRLRSGTRGAEGWWGDAGIWPPGVQDAASRLLWQFTLVYGVFAWVALLGIVYAVVHTASPIRFVSGLNVAWVLIWWYLAIVGVVAGVVFTGIGLVRREWRPPLCSLIVNVLALACALWYAWEGLFLAGE